MNSRFSAVKRKFNLLPDPVGFSISLTPASYCKIWDHFNIAPTSVLYEIGCGKGYPLVYGGLAGFAVCHGIDIEQGSVDRSNHVIAQCRADDRFADDLKDTQFTVELSDGLSRPIPGDATHVQIIIAWTDAQLEELIVILQRAPHVKFFATLAGVKQQRALEQHFEEIAIVSVALESSGERRQVGVYKCH